MNIFITGISKGLGLELANQYAESGHTVIGISRSAPRGIDPQITCLIGDVTAPTCETTIRNGIARLQCLDLVINNAGCGSHGSQLDMIDPVELSSQLALHCVGALVVAQATLDKLRNSNRPKIVNVTSRLGSIRKHLRGDFHNRDFSYCYRIAKCAQNMLTVCMQQDQSIQRIIVAAMNPGLLRTDSGSKDAMHTASEGATAFIRKIETIDKSGTYHAFDEDATL